MDFIWSEGVLPPENSESTVNAGETPPLLERDRQKKRSGHEIF
jgi:hypothetical protein